MQIDREDRIGQTRGGERSRLSIGAILAVAAALGLAIFALPDQREYLRRQAYRAASVVGVEASDEFAPVYQSLHIEPLRLDLVAAPKISPALAKLVREPCDKKAVQALADALVAEGEERLAARAYHGFAAACPDSAMEDNRAGELFLRLGDAPNAITIADALIAARPAAADHRYLRARALASAKRHEEAIVDFSSAIELFHDRRLVHERVFVEMANAYVALRRPCDAALTLLAWVALDPPRRDTPGARKRVAEYLALGCDNPAVTEGSKKL
jgi:tetratricopeptide (TPR) repeat protein